MLTNTQQQNNVELMYRVDLVAFSDNRLKTKYQFSRQNVPDAGAARVRHNNNVVHQTMI